MKNLRELQLDLTFGSSVSLCQIIEFSNCSFSRATAISLSQFDPGKTMTDDFILLF